MARESGKTAGRPPRRGELKRGGARRGAHVRTALRSPPLVWGAVSLAVFTLVVGPLAAWTRERPRLEPGQVARETVAVRVEFTMDDPAATERARERARLDANRVYALETAVLEEIVSAIRNLPAALADVETIEQADPTIRAQFKLSREGLAALKTQVESGQPSAAWEASADRLAQRLRTKAILDNATYQQQYQAPSAWMELRDGDDLLRQVLQDRAVSLDSASFVAEISSLATQSGFSGVLRDLVVQRVVSAGRPLFTFDEPATNQLREEAAAEIEPIRTRYEPGSNIVTAGDVVEPTASRLAAAEQEAFNQSAGFFALAPARLGVVAAVGVLGLLLAGYIWQFCPRIRRNPARMWALAALMAGTAAAAWWGASSAPGFDAFSITAPTLFLAVLMSIAYDQRTAAAFAGANALIVAIGLSLPASWIAILLAGVGLAIWLLREIRDRNTLLRAGGITAIGLALAVLTIQPIDLPASREAWSETVRDALAAGAAGVAVFAVTLYLLALIERAFGITTSMTLIELRDPRQPLLRELQQRAAGTYNHSLNVASLGASAAESIGANALLTYAGALYHDIGKMHKPEYFVENQQHAHSKHEKLAPAMSLLIILGHVKDGIELAREYSLPRSLHHFIEAHHGTTLVEFFYHRAVERAEDKKGDGQPDRPTEMEYRYPGPRPRTKEVAIIMLCDAVESAARAMADPTPARIDQLVRAIANKRLMDGQFDECDLTLRELNTITETVSKALAAIFHGRIAYPSEAAKPDPGGVKPKAEAG